MRHYENFNLKFLSCDSKECNSIFEPGKQNECGWRKIVFAKNNIMYSEFHLCPDHSWKEESLLVSIKRTIDIFES